MALTRTQSLLHTVCDLIPDADQAARIRSMDPYDDITFAEAYCAVRNLPTLTPELRKRILDTVYELADVKTERIVEKRGIKSGVSTLRRHLAPVLRLVDPGS